MSWILGSGLATDKNVSISFWLHCPCLPVFLTPYYHLSRGSLPLAKIPFFWEQVFYALRRQDEQNWKDSCFDFYTVWGRFSSYHDLGSDDEINKLAISIGVIADLMTDWQW